MKQVLMVIAHEGYQQVEYDVPKALFKQANIKVITASDKRGVALAKDGSTTTVDLTTADVAVNEYDAVVFVGGPGAMIHLDNETSYTIIREAMADGLILAAICIAPRIMAKAGVLESRRATGWDGDKQLKDMFLIYGVEYVAEDVVVDELLVTATGPGAAHAFAQQIIKLLQ